MSRKTGSDWGALGLQQWDGLSACESDLGRGCWGNTVVCGVAGRISDPGREAVVGAREFFPSFPLVGHAGL